MTRAVNSGITLSEADAAIVKGMLAREDRQHDIAAWFGVNGGRIAEISTGERFGHVQPQHDDLPPPGPYLSGRESKHAHENLVAVREKLQGLITEVDEIIQKTST